MLNIKLINPFGALIVADRKDTSKMDKIDKNILNDLLSQHKILVFRGFSPMQDDDYVAFCRSLGDLMLWDFGAILNVKMEQDPKNHIFSRGRVELHWDGAFASQTPRINAFQCISSSTNGIGGETLFVDTTRILENTSEKTLKKWADLKLTYSTEKKAHYGGEISVNFIEDHPHRNHKIIRFIEVDNEDNQNINPVQFHAEGLSNENGSQENFFKQITAMLYDPKYMYRHRWSAGDYMLIDNNSVLHGRAKVEGNVKRHLKRIHIL